MLENSLITVLSVSIVSQFKEITSDPRFEAALREALKNMCSLPQSSSNTGFSASEQMSSTSHSRGNLATSQPMEVEEENAIICSDEDETNQVGNFKIKLV